eukprot:TRINITY_DN4780_c0_g2_i1.p2 TRINITY_DN4780_c0_g2~~TRINITY_DN4780_c0_g2_i1.p2  ORF type:complete len:109 (-),score=8.18 TRINITY_DN4780_c0_g2_i1:86-412(-)
MELSKILESKRKGLYMEDFLREGKGIEPLSLCKLTELLDCTLKVCVEGGDIGKGAYEGEEGTGVVIQCRYIKSRQRRQRLMLGKLMEKTTPATGEPLKIEPKRVNTRP